MKTIKYLSFFALTLFVVVACKKQPVACFTVNNNTWNNDDTLFILAGDTITVNAACTGDADSYAWSNVGLGGLSKSVETKSNKTIDLTGEGYYYFIYDYDWGTISTIFDNLGNTVSYTYSDQLFSSPTGFWAGKRFNVYSFTSSQIGPPSENYQFNF